jgi:hypothetical protein
MPGLLDGADVIVSPATSPYARALSKALGARGVAARLGAPADTGRALVFAGGLDDVDGVDAAIGLNRAAFDAARAVAERFREGPCTFVTVQDTGGDFGLSGGDAVRAWSAGIGALAKTAAEEWPHAAVKAIDIGRGQRSPEAVADAIAAELVTGGPEIEVGLRADGTRWTLSAIPTAAPDVAAGTLRAGDVVIVSGGARGVTASAVVALARATRSRIVLLGRAPLAVEPPHFRGITDDGALKRAALEAARAAGTPASPREIQEAVARVRAAREIQGTLEAVRAAGSEVRYETVDVRDASAVTAVIDRVRREWGPIGAVVHAAGVVADAWIDRKTADQFDRVFDTKVAGLRALLDATQDDPLRFVCAFSSVAARAGNPGQSDYAMANEVMNKVLAAFARRRGDACRVKALGFGPWAGGMVTPALAQHFASRGVGLIPLDAGADAFVAEVLGEDSGVEVVLGGGPAVIGTRTAKRMEVAVDATRWPQLDGHRVQGVPVLPVVAGIEWFARMSTSQGGGVWHLRDLRVLRGVRLHDFDRRPTPLVVVHRVEGTGEAHLELRDAQGVVRMVGRVTNGGAPPRVSPAPLGDARWAGPVYGPTALFHGPPFEVIRAVDGIAEGGARARIAGTHAVTWPGGPWRTDPAALDGALQLGSLWAQHRLGVQVLPMRIGEVILPPRAAPANEDDTFVCELRGRAANGASAVFDADLVADDGTVVAMLREVEVYAAPGGTVTSA